MNYFNLNKILSIVRKLHQPKPINDQILTDLLESEIHDEEIIRLFNFDLKNERHIRMILNKSNYERFQKIQEECGQRKALQVTLYSMNFKTKLNSLLIKSLSYPLFLFCFSLFVMIFINYVLFSMFQSLLSFLGPVLNLRLYKTILNALIGLDITVIVLCCLIWWSVKYHSIKLYDTLSMHLKQHIWQKLISREFCEKFIYFYQLGGSIELIVQQIKWSSDKVLSNLCEQIIFNLESGLDLSHSFGVIDSNLEVYFKMNMEGMDIQKYLQNHNRIQEIKLTHQIKKYGKWLLIYGYIVITLMIVIMYQVMLMPIQMMEELL
jgi:competence protein ComGB